MIATPIIANRSAWWEQAAKSHIESLEVVENQGLHYNKTCWHAPWSSVIEFMWGNSWETKQRRSEKWLND